VGTLAAMKTKPRARRMWANYYAGGDVLVHTSRKSAQSWALHEVTMAGVPVAVIPLDDVPKLMAKAKDAYVDACHAHVTVSGRMTYLLTAIGVLPKPRKGGRK
jgi:hypothetical protein